MRAGRPGGRHAGAMIAVSFELRGGPGSARRGIAMACESREPACGAGLLRDAGYDPVILRGGMGAKSRTAALARLQPHPGGPPLLVVATGPYARRRLRLPSPA
jgi:hypothetical protein